MDRRQALATLLTVFGRAQVGKPNPDNRYNVLIDLDLLKGWEIKCGSEAIIISGKELFQALKGKRV